ncbi:MAG: hypothetical protein KAS12_00280 [Candidatus Aenigmarchaeota archaeon]|nr:hypothetical protein [Candidatus Aenigmarchaeota archaeon]
MKNSEQRFQINGIGRLSQLVRSKLIEIIEEKLNKDKHGYIKLAVSKGKIVKISWEAGETIEEKN